MQSPLKDTLLGSEEKELYIAVRAVQEVPL
jgi:hypothetical protein